jgi:GNAT superfamily N-acetyltransferase
MYWYEELIRYFPKDEMRLRAHFQWLMENRPDIYRVQATETHVLLAVEYPDVIFIDYLYVYPGHRGLGVGSRVLQSLKETGKAVLLEVEPEDPDDPDSVRRRRFYDREGFRRAASVGFSLPSPWTGAATHLDVLCWAPGGALDEDRIWQWMQQMYQDLYAAIDPAIYGKPYPPVSEYLIRK